MQPPQSMAPLLNSKLMTPRPPTGVLQRPRLLRRLDDGLTRRLILVCAPTGFGKTTLVSTWIAGGDSASAWVTLDEADDDPIRFWTYLVSALRSFDPGLGKSALSALMSSPPPALDSVLTPLLNDLSQLQQACVLVVEDYHVITSGEIQRSLAFLVQHLPPALHLVLITRTVPDLPIPILRARDEVVELDSASLRMTEEEARAFLTGILQADLPPEVADSLYQRAEGWPAGLRLLARSIQAQGMTAGPADPAHAAIGTGRYVGDYVVQEILESQPAEVQSFLLKTSFFSRLTGSLCDQITGMANGSHLLERLDRDNLFLVPLGATGSEAWYRYNPLFAESLQYVARQRLSENEIRRLFEAAGEWREARGQYEEAIEALLTAKLHERALNLIEKYIAIHDIAELTTVRRWLADIPDQIILQHPDVCFAYAQVLLYTGDRYSPAMPGQLEPLLHAAQDTWQARGNAAGLGRLLAVRSTLSWWQGDLPRAFEYAHRSLELIPEDDVLYRGSSLLAASREALDAGRILAAQDTALEARAQMGAAQNIHGVLAAIQMLAEAAFWQGELEQARHLHEQVLEKAIGGVEMLDDRGIASLGLCDIAYEQNDLDEAQRLASESLELSVQRGNEALQTPATVRLARIRSARADFGGAIALLAGLTGTVRNVGLLREAQIEQVRWSLAAPMAGRSFVLPPADGRELSAVQREREAFVQARVQLADGKGPEALEGLQNWLTDAEANGRLRSQVEACLLQALVFQQQGDMSSVRKALSVALQLGQAHGLRRLFLDEGLAMAALIQQVISGLGDRSLAIYASTLLQLFGAAGQASQAGAAPVELLSLQELRVLRLLAAGLSNSDMARELVLSTNTVKTHIKSIYRKLGVNSRAQARELARNLKLL